MMFSWQKVRTALAAALVIGVQGIPGLALDLTNDFELAEGPAAPLPSATSTPAVEAPVARVAAASLAHRDPIGPIGESPRERCPLPWCAVDCPRIGLQVFSGFESWRGIVDEAAPDSQGNAGFVTGFNMAVPLIERWGIAGQLGFSSGFYDWMGRVPSAPDESNRAQQQYFITYGFFRRACGNRLQGGIVQDWMVNDNFGAFSQEPTLSQFRAQVGFIINEANEVGVWTAVRDRGATQNFFTPTFPISYRAITQTNLFWHCKWCPRGTDSWIWWGVPAYGRLDGTAGGSIGEFTLGGAINTPVTKRIGAYANFQYMKPSARAGNVESNEEFFDLGVGLSWVPGGTRTADVTGQKWMPLMPVANNGSFMVDRSNP